MNQGVLLLLHALKTLQVNDQDRWGPEDLEFLHCLFMHLAPGAKPSVLVWELLWGHELSETVIDGDLVVLREVQGLSLGCSLREHFLILSGPYKALIEGPTLFGIETNLELEFKVVCLVLLLRSAWHETGRSSLSGLFLVYLVCIGYQLLVLVIFIVKVGLSGDTMKVKIVSQSHFLKWKWAICALFSGAKQASLPIHLEILPC